MLAGAVGGLWVVGSAGGGSQGLRISFGKECFIFNVSLLRHALNISIELFISLMMTKYPVHP